MTSPEIVIDYLANHAERAEELARISWTEWRSIYEQLATASSSNGERGMWRSYS